MPLGQFRDTFIIAIDDEGVAIIDQHVAHERVLFERVMQRLTERPAREPAAARAAARRAAAERARGAAAARGGAGAVRVRGRGVRRRTPCGSPRCPALLSAAEAVAAVRALAEDLEGLDRGARVDEALRRIAATTACHAAVKANEPLTLEKMAHILEELRRTAYSTVCPHGRPVMLRLTRREIEKNFQRI